MTHDDTFWEFEDSVAAILPSISVVPFEISQIAIQEKVTNVDKATGTKHSADFMQQITLLLILRQAGKYGKQKYKVDRMSLQGNRPPIILDESHIRDLGPAALEHLDGKINADQVRVPACVQLGKGPSVPTAEVENARAWTCIAH
jgi:hypothetical protein